MGAFETEYRLFVHYGQRWEHETTESTLADIRAQAKVYRANCHYPVKWSRHRVLTDEARQDARAVLRACQIDVGADFHALSSDAVETLLRYADNWKYRKPRGANGSRGRYFHSMLQRRAKVQS